MPETLLDQLLALIPLASKRYERLILLVGPQGSGKTALLQELSQALPAPYINVNLELSRRLMEIPPQRRALHLQELLVETLEAIKSEILLLDNTELLFDTTLKADPLALLAKASRNRTLVASWNGLWEDGYLMYAAPGHPEYRRYEAGGLLILRTDARRD